jgi:hypothetical protein
MAKMGQPMLPSMQGGATGVEAAGAEEEWLQVSVFIKAKKIFI